MDIIARQVPSDVIRQQPADRTAHAQALVAVGPLAGGLVEHIALGVGVEGRKLRQQLAGHQRKVDRRAALDTVEPAIARFGEALDLVARLFHDHVDRTAGGIAAEQSPLRPPQHLDPLDIEEREIIGALARQIDVIDISSDRQIEGCDRFRVAEAAQRISIGGSERRVVVADEIGHEGDQVDRARHLAHRKFGVGERADCDRYILQPLVAALRGDDDVGDAAGRFVELGCVGWGRGSIRRRGLRVDRSRGQQHRQAERGTRTCQAKGHRVAPCCGSANAPKVCDPVPCAPLRPRLPFRSPLVFDARQPPRAAKVGLIMSYL